MDDAEQRIHVVAEIYENAFSALAVEQAVFYRLLYKYKNAHRRTIYYRKLLHVRKCLISIDLTDVISTIKAHNANIQSIRENVPFVLQLKNIGKTLDQAITIILDCSWHLFHLLKQTFFMSMALVFVAILSRIFVIFKKLLHSLSETSSMLGLNFQCQYALETNLSSAVSAAGSKVVALPNSPEHSESDVDFGDFPNKDEMFEETPTVFSDELLATITALEEQQYDSTDDNTKIPSTEKTGDNTPFSEILQEQANLPPVILTNPPSVSSQTDALNEQYDDKDAAEKLPKRRKSSVRKPKKRKHDEMEDIFGSLE